MDRYYSAYAYCPSLIGGTKEGQQIGTEQNPSEDSIDTEMDIVD